MNTGLSLKQSMEKDIQTLSETKLDIMPANIFYKGLLKVFIFVFMMFFFIESFVAYQLVMKTHWNDYTSRSLESIEDLNNTFLDTQILFHKGKKDEKYYYEKKEKYKKKAALKREDEKIERIFFLILGTFFSPFFLAILMLGRIKSYLIFKKQIKPLLLLGEYFDKKIKIFFGIFLGIFSFVYLIVLSRFHPDYSFVASLVTLLITLIGFQLILNMELSRLGFHLLLEGIQKVFQKHT